MSDRYQSIVVTDLRTGAVSYKIYRRGFMGKEPPLAVGLSKEEAEAEIRMLEQEKPQ